ncbi:MAG: hypothetical protein QXO51_04980 [Halobacteria archaeon]
MLRLSTPALLLAAGAGLAGLWLLGWAVPLPEPPLGDLAPYDGQPVAFAGVARDVAPLAAGTLVLLESPTGSARLFVEANATVEPGDRVSGRGRVERFRGEWEVVAPEVRVEPGPGESVGVAQVAAEPWRFLGRSLNLTGRVDRLFERSLHMEDEFSLTVLKVENPPPGLRAGERATVKGALLYDPERLEFRFRTANATR